MKTTQIRKIIFGALMFCFAITMNAQKFGYIDSAALLAELPSVKAADTEITTYQEQLITSGEQKVKAFEVKYQAYVAQANEGTLSKVQMQQKEAELGQEQQEIAALEVEVQNKILKKREEILGPILDSVKKAVEDVGAENGYTMIFDMSTGTILHAVDSDNVMPLVKAKLGM
ncbi:OmpH family outer membrane protein [Saprospiraceae bacterium]|nr:OmpH family outer membrane protein [Saprospiraceae bacterium]